MRTGQVVLITGAARGIGAEAAKRLAATGARVALLGLEPTELERTAAACGPDALWREVDVTDGDALQAAVDEVVSICGGIDVVIANAGIGVLGPAAEVEPEAFRRSVEVNLVGVWLTLRACMPALKERRGYALINSSVTAIVPFLPMSAVYAATKAGVEGLAISMRAELRHYGVGVGVAYFGFMETDLVAGVDANPAGRVLRESAPFPLNRTYPASKAAAAIVDGVERRRQSVCSPGYIRALLPFRGLLHLVSAVRATPDFPQAEALWRAEAAKNGIEASAMGRGGAAAMERFARTPSPRP